ncbi:MAG: gluconolactonase, partial [Actinobacteria bacterium]|nr:gluconolactonase [Actinomycetota bacterium]
MSTRILRSGIRFGEGPRWHDGRLWYSDFYDHAVHAIDLDGNDERIVEVLTQPSGLGWLPNGDMLISSMLDRKVLRWDGSALHPYADLSAHFTWHGNDMLVVPDTGRTYVGNFGFDYEAFLAEYGIDGLFGEPGPSSTVICRIDPDGSEHVAADELIFPNGMVLTPDGRTLIVAETLALRLTAFDVAADGSLSNRRVWADLSEHFGAPDGICLDAEGAVWIAAATTPRAMRIAEGGEVLEVIETSMNCYALMLGGPEGRHLFMMTAPSSESHAVADVTTAA